MPQSKFFKNYSLLLVLFVGMNISAQVSEWQSPKEKLIKAINLIEDEKMGAAQSILLEFNPNDSFYELSGLYLIQTYQEKDNYEEAFKVAKRFAQDIRGKSRDDFYNIAGECSFFGKNHQEGADLLAEGIQVFNRDVRLYDKIGKNLIMLGKDSLAYAFIMDGLKIDPFNTGMLENLGELNAIHENYTQASMAWYLALYSKYAKNQFSSKSYQLLKKFEAISSGNYAPKEFPFNWDGKESTISTYEKLAKTKVERDGYKIQNYYPKTDEVLLSKIAIDKRYKSRVKLDYKLAKQAQIMGENLAAEKTPKIKGKDFFIYDAVLANLIIQINGDIKLLKPFQYNVLGIAVDKKVQKYNKKQEFKEVLLARERVGKIVSKSLEEIPVLVDGKEKKIARRFNRYSLNLYASGKLMDENKPDLVTNTDGFWQYYATNGFVETEGIYKNGKKEGIWPSFNEKGIKDAEYIYKDGDLIRYKEFEENGVVVANKEVSKNDLIDSVLYYYPDGNKKTEMNFPNGVKNSGSIIEYYSNGVKSTAGEIKNQERNGYFEYFNDLGTLTYAANYKNGKKEGAIKDNYSEGMTFAKGSFENDKREGKWEYFDKYGNLTGVYNYAKGELDGVVTKYYDNGTIESETYYKAGKLDGSQKKYDLNGKLNGSYIYKNEQFVSITNYDINGTEIVNKTNLNNGKSSTIELKHPNNTIAAKGTLKDGKYDGVWDYFNEYGVKTRSIEFKNGKKDGKVTSYYSSGVKSEEYFMKDDNYNGLYIAYHQNGKKEASGYFRADDKVGEWSSYNTDGSLNSKTYYSNGDLEGYQQEYDCKGKLSTSTFHKDEWSYYRVTYDTLENPIDTLYYVTPICTYYYELSPLGDTTFRCNLLHNNLEGTGIRNQKNINVFEANYSNGNINGPIIYKNILGETTSIRTMINGVQTKEIDYYPETKTPSYFAVYKYGKVDSIETSYYPNGKTRITTNYLNGEKHGFQHRYNPEGTLVYVFEFEYGKLIKYGSTEKDLTSITKDKNAINLKNEKGITLAQFEINNGVLDGTWKIFHNNGTIAEVRHYKYASKIGIDTLYFIDGKINEVESFEFGEYNGINKRYDAKGNLIYQKNYLNDKLQGWSYYYDKGKLIKSVYYYNGDAIITQ